MTTRTSGASVDSLLPEPSLHFFFLALPPIPCLLRARSSSSFLSIPLSISLPDLLVLLAMNVTSSKASCANPHYQVLYFTQNTARVRKPLTIVICWPSRIPITSHRPSTSQDLVPPHTPKPPVGLNVECSRLFLWERLPENPQL